MENFNYKVKYGVERKIYFDIDNTLIDTKKLAATFYVQLSKNLNVPIDKIIDIKEEYKKTLKSSTDYCPDDLIRCVEKDLGVKIEESKNPFNNENLYKEALFSETKSVLENIHKIYELGIFSEGYTDYQMKKLKYSGILKYFNKNLIVIERRKLANKSLNKVKPGNYIIEDKYEVVDKLNEFKSKNFITILVDRENCFPKAISKRVRSLDEILDIVEK